MNSVYFQSSIFLAILVTEDGTNLFLIMKQPLSGEVTLKLQTSASRSVPTLHSKCKRSSDMSTKEMEHLFYFSLAINSDQELSWSHFFYIVIGGNPFPLHVCFNWWWSQKMSSMWILVVLGWDLKQSWLQLHCPDLTGISGHWCSLNCICWVPGGFCRCLSHTCWQWSSCYKPIHWLILFLILGSCLHSICST